MQTEGLTLLQLTTVAGIASGTTLLSELLWRTAAASDAIKERFGPIVAVAIGVVLAIVASLLLGFGGTDLAQAIVNGVVGGLTAIGIHDVLSSRPPALGGG